MFLASVFGCSKQSPPSSPAAHTDLFMIDYSHESGGVFYYGRVSLKGTNVVVTCTLQEAGSKKSRDVRITEENFRSVWDSLNQIADFKAAAVAMRRPDQEWTDNQRMGPNDPKTYYGIETFSRVGGGRLYKSPADRASPEFKEWLSKLGYTGQ
jgi:hypothetical protein